MALKHRTTKEDIEITGVLATRLDAQGRRRIALTNDERKEIRRRALVEKAVALFLDLEAGHSRDEIAKELGISVMALKDLTKTEEFMNAYDGHFMDLGHDPRLKATQQAISDLLPRAITEMKRMLIDPSLSGNTRLAVIKEVFRFAGLQEPTPAKSDKAELAEFLKGMGNVTVENVNVAVTPFAGALAPPPKRPEIIDLGTLQGCSDVGTAEGEPSGN